ncbi:glycosyltransferase [Ornithinibacillus gellani]|uniref:glycosyltransferase n=1 Tax=Ornithinibacillus gellani TaxID=2293253 RepID=UPI000F48A4BD|nr:glycosyltransferase [Ornithinibacillus gellani]TQS71167.1 glycosyltransferase [Ornithinibacillus gellani]
MNNCLVLLTNYYPFYKGEEYLETEMNYLSEKFSKIYVIPLMVDNKMKQTRKLPNNIEVIKSNISHSIFGKLMMVLKKHKLSRKKIKGTALLHKDGKTIATKLFKLYFESRSQYIYLEIKKILKNKSFDQYNTITIYSYWLYITARVAVELKNDFFSNKTVYTFSRAHGYDINEDANLLNFLPEREFLLHELDNIFPVSQNGVNKLLNKFPEYRSKIEVRRLGTVKRNIEKKNSNNFLHIVSCSTVRKLKRLDLLIHSLEILEKKGIKYKWTHLGGGPDFDDIKRLADKHLNEQSYHFTNHIKNNEVLDWYENNQTTLFVNTSTSEGVPVSVMEAMSMSLPVIATDVGGTKEIVDDKVTGYLLKKNCTKFDVSNALLRIYNMDKDEYMSMCLSSFKLWDKLSNADRLYMDFVEEIASKSK